MKKYLTWNWITSELNKKQILNSIDYFSGDLLDIGCGNKPYLNLIQSYVTTYIGLDHRKYLDKQNNIEFLADACNLPFKDSSFDTIVSFQVMEHVPEPNKMLSEINRVLKNNNYLIISTPFMWGIHEPPNDFYRYTKYGLIYLLKKHNFKIVYLKTKGGYWIMAGLRFNNYLRNFNKGLLKYLLPFLFFFVQLLSIILDNIDCFDNDTISYFVIAQKNES